VQVIRIFDPMAYKKHIFLGKITKVHGYEGAVNIRLERNFSDKIPEMESVYIEIDGRPVPFFIDYYDQTDIYTLRIKFEDYESTTSVKEFIGCKVFLTESTDPEIPVEDPGTLINFEVLSEDDILIGVIIEIIKNPGQLLLNIKTRPGKEILLPLHEDLIKEIDTENKIVRMIIPEGISDIN
jgi:16S rRNA processing protein RimM